MKYYSEIVNKNFDTVEDLEKAEKEAAAKKEKELALKEERTARAKEVNEAYKNYLDLKAKFLEDYGTYHLTLTDKDLPALKKLATSDIWDIFNNFWF